MRKTVAVTILFALTAVQTAMARESQTVELPYELVGKCDYYVDDNTQVILRPSVRRRDDRFLSKELKDRVRAEATERTESKELSTGKYLEALVGTINGMASVYFKQYDGFFMVTTGPTNDGAGGCGLFKAMLDCQNKAAAGTLPKGRFNVDSGLGGGSFHVPMPVIGKFECAGQE